MLETKILRRVVRIFGDKVFVGSLLYDLPYQVLTFLCFENDVGTFVQKFLAIAWWIFVWWEEHGLVISLSQF